METASVPHQRLRRFANFIMSATCCVPLKKENLAELWFKKHFRAANAMLWEGRLSPAFWADALLDYSQFLFSRAPNGHIGSSTTPWTMLTGFGFCLYFNEVFSSRVEALRHHDQRRALLKRDAEQPDIMDDFADPNSDAVRPLYLDPDSSLPPHPLD